jgi:hypothetical protein
MAVWSTLGIKEVLRFTRGGVAVLVELLVESLEAAATGDTSEVKKVVDGKRVSLNEGDRKLMQGQEELKLGQLQEELKQGQQQMHQGQEEIQQEQQQMHRDIEHG